MSDEKASPQAELMLEALTLFEAILLYFCFILPAMIQAAAAAHNDVQVKQNYIVFSVAPPAGSSQSPLDVGHDIGIYVREAGEQEAFNNLDQTSGGTNPLVSWPGLNYALLQTEHQGNMNLRLGGWLRYDGKRLNEPDYVAAVAGPITVYVYGSDDAAEVQAALATGQSPPAPLVFVLEPNNGFQLEVDVPSTLLERD